MTWISIYEGLPEESKEVLVLIETPSINFGTSRSIDLGQCFYAGKPRKSKWSFNTEASIDNDYDEENRKVTHWCDIPPLPESPNV